MDEAHETNYIRLHISFPSISLSFPCPSYAAIYWRKITRIFYPLPLLDVDQGAIRVMPSQSVAAFVSKLE